MEYLVYENENCSVNGLISIPIILRGIKILHNSSVYVNGELNSIQGYDEHDIEDNTIKKIELNISNPDNITYHIKAYILITLVA